MVATSSTMLELGSPAADFSLPDVTTDNHLVQLTDFLNRPLLVMFICNHCPFVVHIVERMTALANEFRSGGFGAVAISSNDIENYPQDGPEKMREFAERAGFDFPYLFDESQEVAKQYLAACTPDFFVFDRQHSLIYRGQMDASRPSNQVPVTGTDLAAALQAAANNDSVLDQQIPSLGCNIKWKPGNEPEYF